MADNGPRRTFRQGYFLFIIGSMRWLSLTFAVFAGVITASNLPGLLRDDNAAELRLALTFGAVFFCIGMILFAAMTWVDRAYRRHLDRG